MAHAATLRTRIEGMLEARVPSALTPKIRPLQESISCGIKEIDQLSAFPRGTIAEICGNPSSGKTTMLHGLLAQCTTGGEAVAVVDVTDAFDPVSASKAGVVLRELLWIRCGLTTTQGRVQSRLEQALGAIDELLRSGGFGLIALDFGDMADQEARQISLATWFRFRKGVEETQTLLLVLAKQSNASNSGGSVLDLSQSGIDLEENAVSSKLQHIDGDCLIRTLRTRAELLRGRMRKPVRSVRTVGEFSTRLQSYH